MLERALIVALISTAIVISLSQIDGSLNVIFDRLGCAISHNPVCVLDGESTE